MTRLLVSVRDACEARLALRGGAQLIDVKEPSRGSLGAAQPSVWNEVRGIIAGRAPISAALGELLDNDWHGATQHLEGFQFAKLGLAGCREVADWHIRLSRAVEKLPQPVVAVAAAYADWTAASAPHPEEILQMGCEIGCGAFLLDTFEKSGRCLFDVMPTNSIRQLVTSARARGLLVALAGSLDERSIPLALELSPDIVAVRGAACTGSRNGKIDESLVRRLCGMMLPCSKQPCLSLESQP